MAKLQEMIVSTEEQFVTPVIPDFYSPEWSDYALSQLAPNEMDGAGNPTTDGLRRLVGKLIGPVVRSETTLVGSPSESNNYRASVVVHLEILDHHLAEEEYHIKLVSGAADAGADNIDGAPFQKFPTAIAETRAEGRALRKALGLRRTVTSDELPQPVFVAAPQGEELATSTQINHFDVICSRLGLDVMQVINHLNKPDAYSNIKDVPREIMAKFFTLLGEFERGEMDDATAKVLKGCKGYRKGWRGG